MAAIRPAVDRRETSDPLAAALAAVDVARGARMRHQRRRPKDVLLSAPAQRLIPDPVALRIGARQAVRALHRHGNAEPTIAAYELFLSSTDLEGDAAAIAMRATANAGRAIVAVERPWQLRRIRQVGDEHVRAALDKGRGAILTTTHSAGMWVGHYADVLNGFTRYSVSGPWFDVEPLALYAWKGRIRLERMGARFVPAGRNGYMLLKELLERGFGCGLPFDMPGKTPVRFMNKRAQLRSGLARLAFDTGAPICPSYTTFGEDGTITGHHLPALSPAQFDGPAELLQAVAAAFERVLLDRPELWQPHDPGDPVGSVMRVWPGLDAAGCLPESPRGSRSDGTGRPA